MDFGWNPPVETFVLWCISTISGSQIVKVWLNHKHSFVLKWNPDEINKKIKLDYRILKIELQCKSSNQSNTFSLTWNSCIINYKSAKHSFLQIIIQQYCKPNTRINIVHTTQWDMYYCFTTCEHCVNINHFDICILLTMHNAFHVCSTANERPSVYFCTLH